MYREFVLTALWGLLLLGLAACVGAEARRLTTPLPDQRSEPWQQVTKAVQGALGVASETVLPAARRAGSEALVLIRAGHEGGELHPREVDLLRVIAERETARAWGVATLGADVRQRLLATPGLGGRGGVAFDGAHRDAV